MNILLQYKFEIYQANMFAQFTKIEIQLFTKINSTKLAAYNENRPKMNIVPMNDF